MNQCVAQCLKQTKNQKTILKPDAIHQAITSTKENQFQECTKTTTTTIYLLNRFQSMVECY